MKLLRVDSSARRNSITRQLTGRFVEAWQQEHPEGTVIERDPLSKRSASKGAAEHRNFAASAAGGTPSHRRLDLR